jgi:hypothetical protein
MGGLGDHHNAPLDVPAQHDLKQNLPQPFPTSFADGTSVVVFARTVLFLICLIPAN